MGATSQVDSGSWSDWTTTAYREPDCSRPRLPRGAWSRKTSPRTQRLHVTKHLHGLGAVCLVGRELLRLSTNRRSSLSAGGVDEGRPDRRRYRRPVSGQDSKRPRCILIESEGDGVSHQRSVLQSVRQLTQLRPNCGEYAEIEYALYRYACPRFADLVDFAKSAADGSEKAGMVWTATMRGSWDDHPPWPPLVRGHEYRGLWSPQAGDCGSFEDTYCRASMTALEHNGRGKSG